MDDCKQCLPWGANKNIIKHKTGEKTNENYIQILGTR